MTSGANPSGDNLYDTLGVDADATDTEIYQAYRRLARERHPDTNPAGHGDAFAELTDAYDVLRDPERRRAYDDTRRARGQAATAATGMRIPVHHVTAPWQSESRDQRPAPAARTSTPEQIELHLSFDQAALGTTAVLPVDADYPCDTCAGTGAADGGGACGDCGGAGHSTRSSGGINIRTECPRCGGTGSTPAPTCAACSGVGSRRRTRDISVRVPAGVQDGTRLRVGVPGGDELIAVIRADDHPYFTRSGDNIAVHVPVTIAEATLGAVVTVPTLDGAVAIRVPPGTPPGRTMRVKGRGIPRPDHPGDLLVTIDVVIPTELNDTQRAALEAFAAATDSPRSHLEGGSVPPRAPDRDPSEGRWL